MTMHYDPRAEFAADDSGSTFRAQLRKIELDAHAVQLAFQYYRGCDDAVKRLTGEGLPFSAEDFATATSGRGLSEFPAIFNRLREQW